MKLPNKVIPYKESVISKFPLVLSTLENGDYSVSDLYKKLGHKFDSINEYVTTLDCLFYLGKIKQYPGGLKLYYAKRDKM